MLRLASCLAVFVVLVGAGQVQAVITNPLSGEYTIDATVTPLGGDDYQFEYQVTNVNQSTSTYTGLDGLSIPVPNDVTIDSVVVPPPYYGSAGYWDYHFGTNEALPDAENVLTFWGHYSPSVYPVGTTATFSFVARSVDVAQDAAAVFSYWHDDIPPFPYYISTNGRAYSAYTTSLPVPVPEPSTLILLAGGTLGLLACGWRKRRS